MVVGVAARRSLAGRAQRTDPGLVTRISGFPILPRGREPGWDCEKAKSLSLNVNVNDVNKKKKLSLLRSEACSLHAKDTLLLLSMNGNTIKKTTTEMKATREQA